MAAARLVAVLVLACARLPAAGEAPPMPPWITPFPGASSERSGTMTGWRWSRYLTNAPLDQVVAYYRGLLEGAGLAAHPVTNALTTTIRGAAQECSLEITIQGMMRSTSVQVSCRAWESQGDHLQSQSKFDKPVYPGPKVAVPPLAWPEWLTSCDPGASPEIQKGVDQFKLRYFKAEFTSHMDRDAILEFYAGLLNANSYPVWVRSSAITPRDKKAVVEGQHFFGEKPGPWFGIRVQLTPVGNTLQVELRITAHPL